MNNFEKQQAREAAELAETDIIKLMNSDTQYISPCRICDDMFETTDRNETCCEDCRLPNGQKIETIDNVISAFHATHGTYESSNLVICEMCGQTFATHNDNEDYCINCRN
jgi:hypothetical protein